MDDASQIAVFSAGGFLLAGLIFGAWKFSHTMRTPTATAPVYVNIAHRASLMYAFACIVIERFATLSQLPASVEVAAVVTQVFFYANAVATYVAHGVLRDTENQFLRPHKLGNTPLPPHFAEVFGVLLIIGEIGGFAVLLYGAAIA